MTTETVKSAAINTLDSYPITQISAGEGVPGNLRYVDGSAPITSGVTNGSLYRVVRIPSNAKVKSVLAWLDAASTTITGSISVYYSDAVHDGTQYANQGLVVPTTGAGFFASGLALAAVIEPTEESGQSGTYVGSLRIKALWDALGLTSDPGGFFDICWVGTSTAGAAAVVNLAVQYVEGN